MNGKVRDFNWRTSLYEFKVNFEGEYKNNQRQGKRKEFLSNNELIFEGEYLYNQKLKENHILIVNWNLKENIYVIRNGMAKDMMRMVM